MDILYISLGVLLVVVFAALVVLRTKKKSPPPSRPPASASPVSISLNESRAGKQKTRAELCQADADADADATRIYKRPSQASAATRLKRDVGATVAPAHAHLVGLSGNQKGASFQISAEAGIAVGRSASCDIVLADDRVSSRHAWIGFVDGRIVLRDLKSTNGTFLNAQINSSVSEVELRSGDTIFFGGHQGDQFRFVAD